MLGLWLTFLAWMLAMAWPKKNLLVVPGQTGAIEDAAQRLAQGHLVAFPTETVYGLGADGLSPAAVMRIFQAKGRPADHPVILHVGDVGHARTLAAHWPNLAQRLAEIFWPGPLTMILPRAAHVPELVCGGQDTVGIRMPAHPVARELLIAIGRVGSGVIAAPSANRFGAVSSTCAAHVVQGLASWLGPQDLILDGGQCDIGVESTIVDLSAGSPRVLRPGGISRRHLAEVLGVAEASLLAAPEQAAMPRVSDALASHYAPRADARLVGHDDLSRVVHDLRLGSPNAVIICLTCAPLKHPLPGIEVWPMPEQPEQYAKILYACLHDADLKKADLLVIEQPPDDVAWEAVRDRLQRACASR